MLGSKSLFWTFSFVNSSMITEIQSFLQGHIRLTTSPSRKFIIICFIPALTPSLEYFTGEDKIPFSFFISLACLTVFCVTLKNFAVLVTDQLSGTITKSRMIFSLSVVTDNFSPIKFISREKFPHSGSPSFWIEGSFRATKIALLNLAVTSFYLFLPSLTVLSGLRAFSGEQSNSWRDRFTKPVAHAKDLSSTCILCSRNLTSFSSGSVWLNDLAVQFLHILWPGNIS